MMKKGFTLVELLVVIAIIGVLAAAVLVSLAGTRPRARDARRRSDLQNVSRAIQLYADAGASTTEDGVPYVGGNVATVVGQVANYSGAGNLGAAIAPTYIQALPSPPTSNASDVYGYLSFQLDGITEATAITNSFRYRLGAWNEVVNTAFDLSVDAAPANEIRVSQ